MPTETQSGSTRAEERPSSSPEPQNHPQSFTETGLRRVLDGAEGRVVVGAVDTSILGSLILDALAELKESVDQPPPDMLRLIQSLPSNFHWIALVALVVTQIVTGSFDPVQVLLTVQMMGGDEPLTTWDTITREQIDAADHTTGAAHHLASAINIITIPINIRGEGSYDAMYEALSDARPVLQTAQGHTMDAQGSLSRLATALASLQAGRVQGTTI